MYGSQRPAFVLVLRQEMRRRRHPRVPTALNSTSITAAHHLHACSRCVLAYWIVIYSVPSAACKSVSSALLCDACSTHADRASSILHIAALGVVLVLDDVSCRTMVLVSIVLYWNTAVLNGADNVLLPFLFQLRHHSCLLRTALFVATQL